MAKPLVAIVGRPNVGKSMLFNKLVGRRLSIVEDTPGVTRDRIYGESEWAGRKFRLVDTGGIEPNTDNQILAFMREQAQIAIDNADVIIFVTDIKTGLTASDQEVAGMLQRSRKPIVLAVNKMDSTGTIDPDFYEFYNLGLGDPVAISAVHGHGTGDLLDACFQYLPPDDGVEEDSAVVQVAIIGKPNVGKSSLTNKILGEQRVIVSNVAGTTRDAIDSYFENSCGKYNFIDTAGMRKKSKVDDTIEKYSVLRATMAIERSDVCLILIDAQDGVTEQDTKVAGLAHDAGKACIIVVNKWDLVEKDGKTMDRMREDIRRDLSYMPYAPILFISAKTGQGLDNLLEMVILTAEVLELKANPNRRAKGVVIEARLDKARGPVATLLVQNGTLKQGDIVIAGTAVGRVRVMTNDKGRTVKTAGPSVPVEITGLADVPTPGDEFNAVTDERMARELVEQRRQAQKDALAKMNQKVTLDNLFAKMQEGEMKELPLIVKADVQGSAEALKSSLEKISNEEVRVRVIHAGVGAINESDILLASTAGAIVVGFNVRPDAAAAASAHRANVDMRFYRVIYDAIDEIEAAMKGMLAPKFEEVVIGHAEVRMTYKVSAIGTIAGCMVKDGKVTRDSQVRVLRDNIVIHEGEIGSLQRFKDAVKEVTAGYECGMSVVKYNDIKEGDIFECFVMQEVKR